MDTPSHPKPNPPQDWRKAAGLGIQMLATLGLLGWLGSLLDRQLEWEFPVFMLTAGFVGFLGFMVKLYRSI